MKVEASAAPPTRSWSFRNAYAGALGIAERIEQFQAFGNSGQDAQAKKSAAGEFRSELDATRISYRFKLSEPRASDLPHVSWLVADRGFLLLSDLVPLDIENTSVEFVLPAGWTVESSITPDATGRYEVSSPEKSVFFVGRTLRKISKNIEGMLLDTVISGSLPFKDGDAAKFAATVMQKYQALTRFQLPGKSVIMIAPFPVSAANTTWKAETRGSTVMLLIDPAARIDSWTAQLKATLTHELLHLWVPNSLNLEGDYDWFFEGFTIYMALQTMFDLKGMNFKWFLNGLGSVYDNYRSRPDPISLIGASETRWTSTGAHVYVKAMLVAFLYDLSIRKESGGKTTLADIYRKLFRGGIPDGAQGNEVIITLLGSSPTLKDFTKSYIENPKQIELVPVLPEFGLRLSFDGKTTRIAVAPNLTAEQKQLLRSFGHRD